MNERIEKTTKALKEALKQMIELNKEIKEAKASIDYINNSDIHDDYIRAIKEYDIRNMKQLKKKLQEQLNEKK